MSKSTNRRKSIAIALAVLGVAGLSLASAAQLNLTGTAPSLQVLSMWSSALTAVPGLTNVNATWGAGGEDGFSATITATPSLLFFMIPSPRENSLRTVRPGALQCNAKIR